MSIIKKSSLPGKTQPAHDELTIQIGKHLQQTAHRGFTTPHYNSIYFQLFNIRSQRQRRKICRKSGLAQQLLIEFSLIRYAVSNAEICNCETFRKQNLEVLKLDNSSVSQLPVF